MIPVKFIEKLNYFFNKDFDDRAKIKSIISQIPEYESYCKKKNENISNSKDCENFYLNYTNEPVLSKAQEQHLFKKMNYYKYKVHCLTKNIKNIKLIKTKKVNEINLLIDKINEIKNWLVKANVRLGSHTIKIIKIKNPDYHDSILYVINKCVDRFDYNRNLKFSSYLVNALYNEKYKFLKSTRYKTNQDGEVFKKLVNISKEDSNQELIRSCFDELMEKDRNQINFISKILKEYYGFEAGVGDKNLTTLAEENKLCRERVRQLKDEGLTMLKRIFVNRGYKSLEDFS